MHPTIVHFHRVYRGGSTSPALVTASNGRRYIAKFRGSGVGPAALLTEFLVNGLASHWELPVPEARILELPAGTPIGVGTDEF